MPRLLAVAANLNSLRTETSAPLLTALYRFAVARRSLFDSSDIKEGNLLCQPGNVRIPSPLCLKRSSYSTTLHRAYRFALQGTATSFKTVGPSDNPSVIRPNFLT